MKTKYLLSTALFAIPLLFCSCIKEDWGVIPDNQNGTSNTKEWNKNKTVDFYFITNLNDKTTGNYDNIAQFFNNKGSKCSIGIVDRSDIKNYSEQNTCENHSTELAVKTARFTSFAFNKYNQGNIEGSTILFNHKINNVESFKITDDCYIQFIPIMAKSNVASPIEILTPFATVRFDNDDQLKNAATTLKTLGSNTYRALIVGTVKNSLVSGLKGVVEQVDGYTFTQVTKDADNDYAIFMAGPKSWVLRETTATSVSGTLNAYCVSVEASVE